MKMDEETLKRLKRWFASYVQTFESGDPDQHMNIALKEEHTKQVCKEILALGRRLGLNDEDLRLAETIALFHDVGRFEQYARYHTFADRRSADHARLGTEILQEKGVLDGLDRPTRDLILRTVSYHNRMDLPRDETKRCLFFTKLLRDADKLDIWRVVIDYCHRNGGEKNSALELDLPDTPGISDGVYQDMMAGGMVKIDHLENLNDFKLLLMGWIYDINFGPTYEAIHERQYLESIRDVIPRSEKIEEIFAQVRSRLDDKLEEASGSS